VSPTSHDDRPESDADDRTPAPSTELSTALPSGLARGLAFVAILVGGACGALIGYAFADLSCTGSCDTWLGLGALLGAVVAAIGVAVVAILALRAMEEWETVRDRDDRRSS